MLESLNRLRELAIRTLDDTGAGIHDFYFDDGSWAIRYLVIDTRKWQPARLLLISPASLRAPDPREGVLRVALTRGQLELAPDISADLPVSRHEEARLTEHFGWPMYWVSPLDTTIPGYGETTVFLPTHSASEVEQGADPHAPDQHRAADPHLRSAREVEGYHIRAQDGSIGHVEDFILDDADWTIRHLVVDTRNWLPGRRVLLSPGSVADIRWNDREVLVHLNREEIRKSPQYEPGAWVI